MNDLVLPLVGGALIGLATSAMLLFNGRIAGISGIVGALLSPQAGDVAWRVLFVAGLALGGLGLQLAWPAAFEPAGESPLALLLAAGLLVGFGTRLGSGCTSGHGVCGISRASPRSLVATLTFITTGVITVTALRALGVSS